MGEAAKAHGLLLHMDGARLMNAVVESGVDAARYAAPFDSLWIDFSKGLGCPVGAALAGSAAFIEAAWQWKQRLGGAMRQSGIVAAAGLYALDHHVARLAEDHANARRLADTVGNAAGARPRSAARGQQSGLLRLRRHRAQRRWTSPLRSGPGAC